jgi:23S rRNA pseudouridine1911/1915/1917 synthase
MTETRMLPVPDGLAGERVDAGLAKLLGLSRSVCADMITDGLVSQNGKLVSKSDRLMPDAFLEVTLPEPKNRLEIVPVEVADFKIIYQDEDIIVIDKPAGVASHPSVGWDGPTVPGALLALGIQIATSGAQERQGIVQRLDVGTSVS